jgi:two-component system chemotaxis response regulator CheY
MPVMNGLEFVSKVRSEGSTTPIIMVTTEAQKNDVVLALKTGVNDYISKPFIPSVLQEKISRFLV